MTITELVEKAHDNAVKHGFYDCPYCGTPDDAHHSAQCVDNYFDEDKQKNVGELLMLVVSELGEALEAHRNDRFAVNVNLYEESISRHGNNETAQSIFERDIKDTFEDELADAVIRIADMCGYLGIDIEKHIILKMKYNESRPYKHGKKY